jgi:hypothetical protein
VRTRNLSPESWEELAAAVQTRDLRQAWSRSGTDLPFHVWSRGKRTPCVAAFLDPHGLVICSGRITMEHVTPGYGRMGVKADDVEEQLVSLCWAHHLSTFAGYNWATANKATTREYLEGLYPDYYRRP